MAVLRGELGVSLEDSPRWRCGFQKLDIMIDKPKHAHDAFISYSRKNRDFAARLEKALESYVPPKDLSVPQRHLDICRDETDFTGVEYNHAVDTHLQDSAKLIVICSPDCAPISIVSIQPSIFLPLIQPAMQWP